LWNWQARGGVIGGKGYGFQAAYIVSRIPIWLADPDFVQFIQHNQGRGHHVGEVGRFLQALRPGAPGRLQHRCGHVVWVFGLGGQDVEGDDIVGAGQINVDQPVADVGIGKDTLGGKQPKQIIHQKGVGQVWHFPLWYQKWGDGSSEYWWTQLAKLLF